MTRRTGGGWIGHAGHAAAFAHYEPYGIVPDGRMDQLRRVREICPVVRSDACGGFWLVSRHHDVARILRTPAEFSSADGITIPHNPGAPMMSPIDLDPPLQTEFRRLLNPYFTAPAVRPYAPGGPAAAGPDRHGRRDPGVAD